jgi:hypothetical protein
MSVAAAKWPEVEPLHKIVEPYYGEAASRVATG